MYSVVAQLDCVSRPVRQSGFGNDDKLQHEEMPVHMMHVYMHLCVYGFANLSYTHYGIIHTLLHSMCGWWNTSNAHSNFWNILRQLTSKETNFELRIRRLPASYNLQQWTNFEYCEMWQKYSKKHQVSWVIKYVFQQDGHLEEGVLHCSIASQKTHLHFTLKLNKITKPQQWCKETQTVMHVQTRIRLIINNSNTVRHLESAKFGWPGMY